MTLRWTALTKLTPSSRRVLAVTACASLVSLVGALCAFELQRPTLDKCALEVDAVQQNLRVTSANIAQTAATRTRVASTNAVLEDLRAAGVLEPLLGSHAMRAKSLLDPIAAQTGFRIDNVRELPTLPLRVPEPPPEQRHLRQPIEFTGQGSYGQISTFIALTEQTHPFAVLDSLSIAGQPQVPTNHKAVITFEWPAKGEKVKPVAATGGKGKTKKAPKTKK